MADVHQIIPQESGALAHLADLLDEHLAARAVIAGATPGTIYADDPVHPRSAMIIAHHRIYLSGDAGNDGFNQALRRLFAESIYPRALAQGNDAFGLYFSDGWEAPIREVILAGRDPIPGLRAVYEIDPRGSADAAWRAQVPDDLQMVEVSRALLENAGLENLDELREELVSERASADEFLQSSFGLCLVSRNLVVTWCLSEYNLGLRCEVGIATHANYRRRGLAVLTGTAFLALAASRGMTRVGWHCWAHNHGSVAAALRLGFSKVRAYPSFVAFYDPTVNLAVNGNVCLDQADYADADAWFKRALMDEKAPAWVYIGAGCAAARCADDGRAFERLRQALARGYDRRDLLEQNPHLEGLRRLPAWQQLWE